jgi:hypothetical protein
VTFVCAPPAWGACAHALVKTRHLHPSLTQYGTPLFAQVRAHTLVKDSLVGWRSVIGAWSHVIGSVFGEDVQVDEGLLVRGATVLPHNSLFESIRASQIVI